MANISRRNMIVGSAGAAASLVVAPALGAPAAAPLTTKWALPMNGGGYVITHERIDGVMDRISYYGPTYVTDPNNPLHIIVTGSVTDPNETWITEDGGMTWVKAPYMES